MKPLRAGEGVRLVRDVMIPMRDGVLLAADLYVSDDAGTGPDGLPVGPLPVVMEYLPYRKDEVDPTGLRHYLELPRHGYIVARVDIRGTGGSEGHAVDEYVAQEQVDGYDAIEWMAAQPWCDGHVNMIGISYGGFTALQVATLQPPHLTSIIPVDFTDDRYTDDCHYRGGLLRMYYDVGYYGTRMIAWNAMPTDPTFAADGARTIWERHVAEDEPYLLAWLTHQVDGPYWRQGSVADIVDRIVCPTFLIGGWRDGYPNPPTRLFERLTAPKKLLIGPWDHRYPDAGIPGPRIDHLRDVVRWLDHWCLGRDDGLMDEPAIAVFMQEAGSLAPGRLESAGRWRAETAWPPAGATDRAFDLGPEGRLTEDATGAGPADAGTDHLLVDPTVGAANGLWSGGVQFGLTGRPAPGRSPVPDLYELGRSTRRCRSSGGPGRISSWSPRRRCPRRGRQRVGRRPPRPVAPRRQGHAQRHPSIVPDRSAADWTPGRSSHSRSSSTPTGWRFGAGHRIRVSIAGADWPNVWPTPAPATLELHRGPDAPLPDHAARRPRRGPRRGAGLRPVARGPASRVRLRPARRLDCHARRPDRPRRVRDPVPDDARDARGDPHRAGRTKHLRGRSGRSRACRRAWLAPLREQPRRTCRREPRRRRPRLDRDGSST